VILAIEVVICIKLHFTLPLSACVFDLLGKSNDLFPLDGGLALVLPLSEFDVSLVIGVDAGQGPLVIGILGVVGQEF
jgi:hypothetical protein